MKAFAARMGRVPESGTVRIADALARLRQEGRRVVDLSVGEPDFDTPAPAREALKRALDAGHTRYGSAWGLPTLREAIARKCVEENGIPCGAADVLVTPAKQAVLYAILALVEEGDEVLIPDPAWVTYAPLVALSGGTVVRVPTTIETGFRMTPEAVSERITPRTKLLVVNSPSNPTGAVATPDDVRGWADLARDHDLWVLSDELYERIVYEGRHVSPASLPGMMERTLTVNGFSKAYAMTGWRVGWVAAPQRVLRELVKLQQHSLTHPATFAQHGALEALRMDQAPVAAMREAFRARRDLLVEGLLQIPGWRCARPQGAYFVFARFDHPLSSTAMAERLLQEGGVAVTPGIEFGPLGEGHVRLSYAASPEALREGLARIAEVSARLL